MHKGSFVLPKSMLISIPNPLATVTWLESFNFHERKKKKNNFLNMLQQNLVLEYRAKLLKM